MSNRANHERPKSKSGGVKIAAIVALCLLAFCIGSVALLGINAACVVNDLQSTKESLKSGEFKSAADSTERLVSSCENMEHTLDSPVWYGAGCIPALRDDLTATRQFVHICANIASDVLLPVTQSLSETSFEDLVGVDRTINISAIGPALETIQRVAPTMQSYASALESIEEPSAPIVEDTIDGATRKIADYDDLLQKAALLAPVASAILDKNNDKTFLLVAQNSAETRSAGGFPGAMGTLNIASGSINLGSFATPYELLNEETLKEAQITASEAEIYDNYRMTKTRDINFNPDFPRVASIWSLDYEQKNGDELDGVISIVPSVVQKLLASTNPITLSDGTTLNGDNATRILQHDMYWKYLSEQNYTPENAVLIDGLFSEAAQLAFENFFSSLNSGSIVNSAKVFLDALNNREIMLWLEDPELEAKILAAGYGGALNSDPEKPEVGVFASLSIASKLGWYLDIDTNILGEEQNPDGTTTYHLSSVFANSATQFDVDNGGSYIMGTGAYRPVGDMSLYVYIFAPAGGTIDKFETDANREFKKGTYDGLDVEYIHHLDMQAGCRVTCTYDITVSKEAKEPLKLATVPTLTDYR